MVKRNYIADSFKWIGCLALILCLYGGDALAISNNSSTASKVTSGSKPASMLSKSLVSKVSNVELIYADGGVRVRVHTGALAEFSHQIEPPKNGRPYRIILDVLNSIHNLGGNKFSSLPNSVIQRIRSSQFAVKPQPITRIVLDLGKEAFYRIEQQPEYIDLFVTDRKAKRFNSWSSARWLAARAAKAEGQETKSAVTVAAKSAPQKPKSAAKSEANSEAPAFAKTVAQVAKVSAKESSKKLNAKSKSNASSGNNSKSKTTLASLGQASQMSKKPVQHSSKSTTQVTKSPKEPAKSQAVIVAAKPVVKKEAKQVKNKPAKVSTKTAPVKKPLTVAVKGESHSSKKLELKSNPKSSRSKSAATQEKSVKAPMIATATSPTESLAKVSSPKKGASNKGASNKVASNKVASKTVAPKKSVSQKSGSVTLANSKQSKAELLVKSHQKAQKQPAKVEKKSPALAVTKPAVQDPAKLSNSKKVAKVSKSVKSKSGNGKAAQLATNSKTTASKLTVATKQGTKTLKPTPKSALKVATKTVARTATKTATKAVAQTAPKEKAKKSSSSLFATTANAATPGRQTYKDSESDRRYKAQFRRSIDQRKIKLKGAQVAEFPKRLTIKYKTHGTRDPFGTLLAESSSSDDFLMKELPNVEALTMVGILRDVKGKTRGLFEDIDGRGYILSKGDKVHNGTVLKVTRQKAYFQIFEYGWSRTVALSLEG